MSKDHLKIFLLQKRYNAKLSLRIEFKIINRLITSWRFYKALQCYANAFYYNLKLTFSEDTTIYGREIKKYWNHVLERESLLGLVEPRQA